MARVKTQVQLEFRDVFAAGVLLADRRDPVLCATVDALIGAADDPRVGSARD